MWLCHKTQQIQVAVGNQQIRDRRQRSTSGSSSQQCYYKGIWVRKSVGFPSGIRGVFSSPPTRICMQGHWLHMSFSPNTPTAHRLTWKHFIHMSPHLFWSICTSRPALLIGCLRRWRVKQDHDTLKQWIGRTGRSTMIRPVRNCRNVLPRWCGGHRWELPGNYRDFRGVTVIYLFCRRTKRVLITLIIDFEIYILTQSLILFI